MVASNRVGVRGGGSGVDARERGRGERDDGGGGAVGDRPREAEEVEVAARQTARAGKPPSLRARRMEEVGKKAKKA